MAIVGTGWGLKRKAPDLAGRAGARNAEVTGTRRAQAHHISGKPEKIAGQPPDEVARQEEFEAGIACVVLDSKPCLPVLAVIYNAVLGAGDYHLRRVSIRWCPPVGGQA